MFLRVVIGFVGVLCVVEKKKNLKNELNQRKGRWVCGHTGSAMGTCWWYGGFVKGGELLIQVWLREK